MKKILKTKIYDILKEKGLSLRNLEKIFDYSRGGLSQMINGQISFSETIKKKILPILEISENEFESWIVTDKYSKELIRKAIEAFKAREDKKTLILTQNIDKILKEKNLSRTALAKAIKYNQPDVNRMITGQKAISKTVLTRISEFLEIPEEDLLAWVLADKYSLKILELALKAEG